MAPKVGMYTAIASSRRLGSFFSISPPISRRRWITAIVRSRLIWKSVAVTKFGVFGTRVRETEVGGGRERKTNWEIVSE